MHPLDLTDVRLFVEQNIGSFHEKRLIALRKLKLDAVLKRKNPYLFKAKNILTAEELIRCILDAHLSSQEETIFGDFLEALAIFVNGKVYSGSKSSTEGIDLDFSKDGIRYLVSIKSGPNWSNSSQLKKMRDNFRTAKKVLRTGGANVHCRAVNGCCYGSDNSPDKGDYDKLCGQRFWSFISGDNNLYTEIIEPLGHQAKAKNDEFAKEYASIVNQFTSRFGTRFLTNKGAIDWTALVAFNSSSLST